MSKITPAITAKLADLEKQIRVDLKQFNADFNEALSRAENAAISGWSIGKALLSAKQLIPHGAFMDWFSKFGVPERTGQRFMEKAREYPELKDFVANRREAILSTGLLPDKPEVHHEGNVQFPAQGAYHQRFYNRFCQWKDEVTTGKLQIDEVQVKTDLRPMYEWLRKLYGE